MNGSLNSFVRASFVRAFALASVGAAGVAVCSVAGCSRAETHADTKAQAPASARDAEAADAASPRETSGESDSAADAAAPASLAATLDATTLDATLDPMFARALPIGGKSVGHTSVVFKLRLEGGLDAAYKPQSKRGHGRYRGEIAAYRLARALGLSNVPPAIARSFSIGALRAAVGSEAIFDDVVPGADGQVEGALIPWIKGLDLLPLEKDPWWERWHGWLARGGAIPDDQRAMASQISTMIVFDYITGNWDRWSGGNVGIDPSKRTILYIDNDGAFFDPPPAPALARQLGILEKVDRFSRSFVAALRAVDLRAAINTESSQKDDRGGAASLLSSRVFEQVEVRRKKALAIVDAKIQAAGDGETLAFE